jgi:DNA/RNA-binding protein KIN17
MPRAEAGSTKAIANKIKSKGLTRLRWYCQACEKACRDENGFKCHVQSESHVRQMLLIGENSKQAISDFSNEFQRNFINLLKTSHGEKQVNINHFYQQVISDKTHTHMNSTRWTSLTQFAMHLGREGICRVEETEKGLFISWIDSSPDTLRRREALLKKERQDKGDEEREQRQIQEQVERAQRQAEITAKKAAEDAVSEEAKMLQRKDGEKVKLSFGAPKSAPAPSTTPPSDAQESSKEPTPPKPEETTSKPKVSMSFGGASNRPKNVFSSNKSSNPLAAPKKSVFVEQPKKMSEQERIMKMEMEAMQRKKRPQSQNVFEGAKRTRVS